MNIYLEADQIDLILEILKEQAYNLVAEVIEVIEDQIDEAQLEEMVGILSDSMDEE
jgi:hypothetical protein